MLYPAPSSMARDRPEQRSDCRPELLLDPNGNRVRKRYGPLMGRLPGREHTDGQFAIGVISIATPIPARYGRADAGDLVELDQAVGLEEVGDQAVSLGVDVRRDVMGDLSC